MPGLELPATLAVDAFGFGAVTGGNTSGAPGPAGTIGAGRTGGTLPEPPTGITAALGAVAVGIGGEVGVGRTVGVAGTNDVWPPGVPDNLSAGTPVRATDASTVVDTVPPAPAFALISIFDPGTAAKLAWFPGALVLPRFAVQ